MPCIGYSVNSKEEALANLMAEVEKRTEEHAAAHSKDEKSEI